MSTLLSLPNELLNHIINDVHIDDIEAFSSCCKQVKVLAAARLEKHLWRKFKFPNIAIENARSDDKVKDEYGYTDTVLIPMRLLRDFLMDEENTLYPRSMSISIVNKSNYWNEEYCRPLIARYMEQYPGLESKIVAKVMQMQDCLDGGLPAIEAQDWINCIKNGEYYPAAALLMPLFPNVKVLRIFGGHISTETLLMHTLKKLVLAAAKNETRALGPFSELLEVRLDNSLRRHFGALGELIALFMFLPTMRIVEAHGIYWPAGDSPTGPVTSSVKEILLESSQIDSEHLMVYLEKFKTLERFTYNMVQTCQPAIQWEPRRIVGALQKYARRTLVHLELTGDVRYLSENPIEPFVGTLRSFQVLESVRLMSCMLFKPVDGEDSDENEEISKGSFEPDVDPHPLVEPRRLVDVLPYSARKLMLVGGLSNEEARDMFADLSELKRERMPMLSEIVLEDSDSLEQETKNLCKYAGIRLKSVMRVVHGYQRIYAVTKPAPQVDDLEC